MTLCTVPSQVTSSSMSLPLSCVAFALHPAGSRRRPSGPLAGSRSARYGARARASAVMPQSASTILAPGSRPRSRRSSRTSASMARASPRRGSTSSRPGDRRPPGPEKGPRHDPHQGGDSHRGEERDQSVLQQCHPKSPRDIVCTGAVWVFRGGMGGFCSHRGCSHRGAPPHCRRRKVRSTPFPPAAKTAPAPLLLSPPRGARRGPHICS